MSLTELPPGYLLRNSQQSKRLVLVVTIEGVPFKFALTDIYTRVRYGDPGITYGLPGLRYGSLKRRSDVKSLLTLNGSLTISQKLEPEQGRASISTFTLVFIDKDGYMTKLISPGVVVDELMGDRETKIYLGYQNSSFPEDYFIVFRGNVSTTEVNGPEVTLSLSDPNQRRRQEVFNVPNFQTTGFIDTSDTTVPVSSTSGYYQKIIGPDLSYDPIVNAFIKIDEEYMLVNSFDATNFYVTRNVTPVGITTSVLSSHPAASSVSPALQLGVDTTTPKGVHSLQLALKIMLSGWNGPWLSGQSFTALGNTLDPGNPVNNVVYLPLDVDADQDLGQVVGDYIYVTGSGAGNNGTYVITGFDPDFAGRPNRLIYINANLTPEAPGSAQLAYRSQFDTLPDQCGLRLKPTEVDVERHVSFMETFFTGGENYFEFEIEESSSGKEFIEKELYLALRAYSLTRFGRLSMGYTRPPIPGTQLLTLNADNVIEPNSIKFSRSLVTRRFYNEVDYDFEFIDGNFTFGEKFVDFDSNSSFGQSTPLPIQSKGARASLGGGLLAENVSNALLTRFKDAAFEVMLSVNWGTGSQIEVGDVVIVDDPGTLQIPNILTGKRGIGQQLFEVINRSLDVKSGLAKLTLLSGIFDTRQDRYGTIAPSSQVVASGSTTSSIVIKPSFGALFGSNEFKKWVDYIGLKIAIHSVDYSRYEEVVLSDVPSGSHNVLTLATPIGFSPQENDIVDLAFYSTSTDPSDQALAKLIHWFWSPSVPVVSGSSTTSFDVSGGNISKFFVNGIVQLHNVGYSRFSPETKILSVIGTTVTVADSLGFTPNSSDIVEFIGFPDQQGAYRLL